MDQAMIQVISAYSAVMSGREARRTFFAEADPPF